MISSVVTEVHARRWAALLCIVAVVFAALTPAAPGLLCAILVPLWIFCGLLTIVSARHIDNPRILPPLNFFLAVPGRAPPLR